MAMAAARAPAAFAHAELLGSSPRSSSTVQRQPREVIFEFNEAVGGTPGAVRVYDAQGKEVDDLDVAHPGGRRQSMGVGLRPGLPDGTYTATYRVISADTHVVYGGLVFNIGHPGAAPRFTIAGLVGRNRSGKLTALAFGVVRGLDYLSIALLLGGVGFLIVAWLPAFAAIGRREPAWEAAARAFERRFQRLLLAAVGLGILASALGILLQGASAAGLSLWASLNGSIVQSTLESRFGVVWGVRALDWLMLGALLVLAWAFPGAPRASRAPTSVMPAPTSVARAPRWLTDRRLLLPFGAGAAYLAITPALAGHASVDGPTGAMVASDIVHVLAASLWVGGIACLLLVLPRATRRLEGPDRSRLLLATLVRFSPLALVAVIAIAATGVFQTYINVRSLDALLNTTYGVLILVKIALLLALISLGWINRQRVIPALERLLDTPRPPGATGILARRTMRGEFALMLGVLAATAALVSYTLPVDADSGPFSANTALGPIVLEMTVDPARTGLNTIHLYLIDATSGTQFTGTKELTVTAALPAKRIGPLALQANLAGPGHYVLNSAALSPGGEWALQITDRVSEFNQYSHTVKVPIR
jgi:copper transport protein